VEHKFGGREPCIEQNCKEQKLDKHELKFTNNGTNYEYGRNIKLTPGDNGTNLTLPEQTFR
jgi:hypothetical protein